ncbi:barrier-to-autointegration factor-like [Actinia tenebrosa]|uniref:Barrier-to-autointegration factor-like protein n=1 Tax=Actinia tenebrosa TaxID=6105 RepID=A0A6P8H2A1_ACTTE|nr:barrier-to-autointegration factor-like [Actinia tenebrosa]
MVKFQDSSSLLTDISEKGEDPSCIFLTLNHFSSDQHHQEMNSTSQKHENFVSEPMREKPVTELAGIGEVLGGKLKDKGFDYAYEVLAQFLKLKKDEEQFRKWLEDLVNANKKQSSDCYTCLKEWCIAHL